MPGYLDASAQTAASDLTASDAATTAQTAQVNAAWASENCAITAMLSIAPSLYIDYPTGHFYLNFCNYKAQGSGLTASQGCGNIFNVDKRRGAQDAQITFEDPADLNKEIKEVRCKRQ